MDGALGASGALDGAAVVGLRCRTSERSPGATRGVDALAPMLAQRLGTEPRMVGSPEPPRDASWEDDLASSRGCLLEAGGQVDDALGAGRAPVLVAGECSVALTTLPAALRNRPDAKVLWLDAHGDFNTPETSRSAYLGGMCLAGACGRWDAGLGQEPVAADQVVLCGVRDLDPSERDALERSGAVVVGAALETLVHLVNALDGAPVYVHADLDVLDPEEMPARVPAPGGLAAEKLADLSDAVADSCEVVGLEVTCLEDPALAPVATDALAPLLDALSGRE